MYKEFYLMRKEPFDSHPSPDLFYKSDVHQTAWHYLLQGIKQHEPILLVSGDYGAGKTLLFLKLVRLLQDKGKMPVVSVPTPTYNFVMVLEKIIERLLNIPSSGIDTSDESRLQQVIYEYFEAKKDGKKEFVYVVIDDVQEFSYAFINKLRIFASYNVSGYFPIRIVLFGHHSFMEMLNYKKMVAFGQRIKRIYYLKPLNCDETREYIYFRLIHSGATGTPIFDDDAIRVIQSVSKGNPRLINNVCDNCLLLAGNEKINLIDVGLVKKAMELGRLPGLDAIEVSEIPDPQKNDLEQQPFQAGPGFMPQPGAPAAGPPDSYSGQNSYPGAAPYPGQDQSHSADPMPAFHPQPEPQYQGGYPPSFQQPPQFAGTGQAAGPAVPAGENRPGAAKNETAWSRYWKIGVIIALLLVALVLASRVFGSNAKRPVGEVQHQGSKITREMPVQNFTVLKKIPEQPADAVPGEGNSMAGERENKIVLEKRNYQPVLLTESIGS